MANNYEDDEIDCKILESLGVFSQGRYSQGSKSWVKEVNLISWNGRSAKLDIRNWQKDHSRCGKGIAITREEAEELVKLLSKILREKPKAGRAKANASQAEAETKTGRAGAETKGRKVPPKPDRNEKPQRKTKILVPQSFEPFYDELELTFAVAPGECKKARNTLLKKYHPDKNAANVAFATRKTIKIKEAYDRIIAWWKENDR